MQEQSNWNGKSGLLYHGGFQIMVLFLSPIGKKMKKHLHSQNTEMMCRISGIDNFILTSLI